MENALRKWLDKRQYTIKKITNDKSLFYFLVTDEQERPINVVREKVTPSVIRLILAFNEKELEVIREPVQQGLRFLMGVEMARFGLLYSEKPVLVHFDLPIDDLVNENTFLNAIDRVRQAHVLMLAHIRMAIAEAKASSVKEQVADKANSQNEQA